MLLPLSNILLIVLLSEYLDLDGLNDEVLLLHLGCVGLIANFAKAIPAQGLHILYLNFLLLFLDRCVL